MNTALIFLLARSVRGRIVRTLRLLKEPKYLIGVVAFVLWMTFTVGSAFIFDDRDDVDVEVHFANAELFFEVMGEGLPAFQLIVAVLFALALSLWWLIPWSRMALDMNEAEIHILTPMPIKRRHLIQYATFKSQPGILFGCLMMTIFLGGGGPLARLAWFASFWLVLTLWDMHAKGRAMWLERQKELPPAKAWRNRLLLVGGITVFWVVLGAQLSVLIADVMTLQWPEGTFEGEDFDDFGDRIRAAMPFIRETMQGYSDQISSTLLGWMLTPFKWITAPLFVNAPGAPLSLRLTGLAMPIILLVLQNEWVVRSRTKFEEAALAHAQREATKTSPGARYWKKSESSRLRAPFKLGPVGPPEIAILWKNSMMISRFSYKTLLSFGVATIALAMVVPFLLRNVVSFLPYVVLSLGFMSMVISPMIASQNYRNDLRNELLRLEMVRPWPIEGWKLFAAEVASPTIYGLMSGLLGAGLVFAMDMYIRFIGIPGEDGSSYRTAPEGAAESLGVPEVLLLPMIMLGAVPLVIALTFLFTSLQNLLVLLFPGWVQLGNDKQQGAAAFGQNMVMFFGLGLTGLACLLPAAIIIGIIVASQIWIFGVPLTAWEFPILGIIAATPVFAVVGIIIRSGGRIWDDLDASKEILGGSG